MLLIGNDFVVEHRFVAFEEGWATKDTDIGKAGLVLVAELIWSCKDSIDISDILSWTYINSVDSIGMCMIEEGAAKSGIVEKNVGGDVYFAPFGFADAIHFLMFGGSSFRFYAKDGT